MKRGAIVVVCLLAAVLFMGAKKQHFLADRWADPDYQSRRFQKLLIVAISDDVEARKQFENKFVSHLRGRGLEGVTSYSIVPDLTVEQDEAQIVQAIDEQAVDAAISVRLVPLRDMTEDEWGTQWRAQVEAVGDLRELIDESLPVDPKKAKAYGVEVALWETERWSRIWAARSDTYKRKELSKEAGNFVQTTMQILWVDKLL